MTRLVLASASPRRRALLAALGLDFEVVVSGAEETFEGTPVEMVITNARAKRDDTAKKIAPGPIVIAADTLVFLGKHVLGKPADRTEACAMIARLSGKTHHVLTGLSMVDTSTGRTAEGYESTGVTFRDLAPSEIEAFVDAVNPIDRAGAYTVDGPGSLLVARYDGCYQNVLGLPVVRLDRLLRELGVSLFEEMNAARCLFL
ncbi:MAG TPA: Maf family protein [Candidatus Hydrogenedentes bacterium]|nr:Maf family protein [Candidatus Hydrogenedentota bacterium]HRT21369.1 Maf family protein [Candidatus Hydrogenedentota bacterium]HRT65914.1 Maf family protein [Candidatus Hydrogenedentota bacterium]